MLFRSDILYFLQSIKGFRYGLVISDLFSLYISFYPLKTKNSSEIAEKLRSYFAAHCPPTAIYSDNDTGFRGEVEALLRIYNVRHITSYPYTQKQNYVESQIRTFKNAYRAALLENEVFKTRDWDVLYPLVVCRINAMISKYGLSRETVHYGYTVESSLPIITDVEALMPLEEDLEKTSKMFRDKIARFMSKRSKNKEYYKIGKKYKYYVNELIMYKEYVPSSMIHNTYKGPARIEEINSAGALVRDPKTGAKFSVNYENMRKLSFDELLSLLPQNFDDEIAKAVGNYRYRKASDLSTTEKIAEMKDLEEKNQNLDMNRPENVKKTRSGKVYLIKNENIPEKYKNEYEIGVGSSYTVKKPRDLEAEAELRPCIIYRRRIQSNFQGHTHPNVLPEFSTNKIMNEDKKGRKIKFSFDQEKGKTMKFKFKNNEENTKKITFGEVTVHLI